MTLIFRFALLVVVLSIGEFYLLLWVAARTSIPFTLVLCVLTGLAGGALVRSQGLSTWRTIQNELAKGRAPTVDIVSGLILIVIGAFLLTPGFITDTVAFLLLPPGSRRWAARLIMRYFKKKIGGMGRRDDFGRPRASARHDDVIIEVEAQEVTGSEEK